jgi:hypothetical protein
MSGSGVQVPHRQEVFADQAGAAVTNQAESRKPSRSRCVTRAAEPRQFAWWAPRDSNPEPAD